MNKTLRTLSAIEFFVSLAFLVVELRQFTNRRK